MKISFKNLSIQLNFFIGFQLFLIIAGFFLSWVLPAMTFRYVFYLIGGLIFSYSLVFYILLRNSLISPLEELNQVSTQLVKGSLKKEIEIKGLAETETLSENLNKLNHKLKEATEFIHQIGDRNFGAEMTQEYQKSDKFTSALLNMRDKLRKLSDDEDQRTWINQNIAKFGEILRARNDSFKELSLKITSELVKILQVHQGFLFILNDDDESDIFLELSAAYAYDRKKFLKKRIEIGEGLIGQTYLEKQTTYLREIPENYLQIQSGAGEAKPASLLIVPLITNEGVQGIVELASFTHFKPFQVEFVEKIGESIAITITNLKVNERTKVLLESSQLHSEELQSREEELRQNMEEMQATQEEVARQQNITEGLINNSTDTIVIVNTDLRIILVNNRVRENYAQNGIEVQLGVSVLDLLPPEEKEAYLTLYNRALSGEDFTEYTHFQMGNIDIYYEVNYFPLRQQNEKVMGACVIARDITERKKQEQQIVEINEQLQASQEELRQNMEEMQTTHESSAKQQSINEALIDSTDNLILVVDNEQKISLFNKKAKAMYAQSNIELKVGSSLYDIYPSSEKAEQKKRIEKVLKGEEFKITTTLQLGDHVYPYELNYFPLREKDNNNASGACIIARSVL
jgi:methyl-accepting chemotaxis protein